MAAQISYPQADIETGVTVASAGPGPVSGQATKTGAGGGKCLWVGVFAACAVLVGGAIALTVFLCTRSSYSREEHLILLRDGKFAEAAEMHQEAFDEFDIPKEDIENVKKLRSHPLGDLVDALESVFEGEEETPSGDVQPYKYTTFQYFQLYSLVMTYKAARDSQTGSEHFTSLSLDERTQLVRTTAMGFEVMATGALTTPEENMGLDVGTDFISQKLLDEGNKDKKFPAEAEAIAKPAFKKAFSAILDVYYKEQEKN